MHTVCETHAFRRTAEEAGMTEDEIADLIDFLAEHPEAGDEIAGSGGCRKVRVAGRGKGKSDGYRTITFYSGEEIPVFLLTVFSKGERSNLTKGECNDLRAVTKALAAEYKARAKTPRRQL
ncbi:MAG TPA: type II toxin-antitoxin system RelE/ParE family toxin, partial [Roseiarcus sp.]|nr:type II toxin-antitoxin system RelE/ParE family toxin [Roseiarcus sp.]